jgi:hypothetical protein
MIHRLLLLLFLLSALKAWSQNYQVYRPPSTITVDRLESISIVTRAEMELGELPDHPKITWLGYSSIRLRNNGFGEMQTDNRISFIANAPGVIEFPPIPIVLENKEFFIRIGEVRVEKNEASESDTGLEILWNGQPEIPEQVHLGEAVEVEFKARVLVDESNPSSPGFSQPSNRVKGGRWHRYYRYSGRKPIPSDYYHYYSRPFFNRYSEPENFTSEIVRIAGDYYRTRSYKARLYFTKAGKATGDLSITLGTSTRQSNLRTHVLHFEIGVVPLPPLTNDQAFDTGLIGDFEIEASYHPAQPIAERPFQIRLSIRGQGNPNLRNDFDFSADGFPSSKSELYPRVNSNYKDFWEADFDQTLYPTGKVGTFPPITLATFDTVGDQWRYHKISPAMTLPGFEKISESLAPRSSAGASINRPILLNLPATTFAAFAFAPLLPFLFGFARKRLDARDPGQKRRERTLTNLIADFEAGKGSSDAIDDKLLPILRHHLKLPEGATVREIASALEDPELAASLEAHAESSFSTTAKPVDYPSLARQLAKLSLIFFISLASLRGATLEEANAAFEKANYRKAILDYQSLLESEPNRPGLHFNLAQAYLSANEPARAHASCYTALLLDPLDSGTRDLMEKIRERQGDLTVGRNRFLDLRPDQWILLSSLIWILAFLWFGLRKLRALPRWPGFALILLALVLLGTATWRHKQDYAPDQYMVLADELPREPEAGTPDWNYPALRAGEIVQVSEINETHARVRSDGSSFWLPISDLQQVW